MVYLTTASRVGVRSLAARLLPVITLSITVTALTIGWGGISPAIADDARCVVLLHGMARSSKSMKTMAKALRHAGYLVENVDYPSTSHDVDQLAELAVAEGLRRCQARIQKPVSFVTHSLGGILLRYYLQKHPQQAVDRVVMLGPPNQGSEVVDRLKNLPGFNAFNGPVGRRLGTAETDLPRSLGRVNFELGVIAGTRSINPLLSQLLPNPDDGKVSVINTRVEGMCDFVSLPVSHALMMRNRVVISRVVSFLSTGRFLHDAPSAERCD